MQYEKICEIVGPVQNSDHAEPQIKKSDSQASLSALSISLGLATSAAFIPKFE